MPRPLKIALTMIDPPLPFGNAIARWSYVLLKGLVERGHHVRAFATVSRPSDLEPTRDLFPETAYDLRCYLPPSTRRIRRRVLDGIRPYSYTFTDEMFRDVHEGLRWCDAAHLERLWSTWLCPRALEVKALHHVENLMQLDFESVRGARGVLERRRIYLTERWLLKRLQNVMVSSPRIAPYVLAVQPRAHVDVVPMGIDYGQYDYIADEARSTAPIVSVIGSMTWYPSAGAAVRFLERLWPAIQAQVPAARAQIVGWSARSVLARFIDMPGVTIEESVPSTRPHFERTSVLLYAPSSGSGMKIKILEAFAYGVPVVTTSEGVEGLPAVDGVHAGICEDDQGLIARTVDLLKDRERQNRQRGAARKLLEEHCSPTATVGAVEARYLRIIEACSGRA